MSDVLRSDELLARWQNLMRRGEAEAAWRISDAVLRARGDESCDHLPRHLRYFWDGTPLEGRRVLVRCYHGLGDTIQFIRYLPRVRRIAASTGVLAQTALLPLLERTSGIDDLYALPTDDDGCERLAREYDSSVEVMELPHVFRTTLADVPSRVPYFDVEPQSRARESGFRVGVVWQAGEWDSRRSIPLDVFAELMSVPGVEWFVFQHGAAAERESGFGEGLRFAGVLDEAAALRSLDLFITIDSMPAHLAGALAVPTWTLLHAEAACRWLRDRSDCPWYPTMRLFRQERAGDWRPVIARVAAELRSVMRQTRDARSDRS